MCNVTITIVYVVVVVFFNKIYQIDGMQNLFSAKKEPQSGENWKWIRTFNNFFLCFFKRWNAKVDQHKFQYIISVIYSQTQPYLKCCSTKKNIFHGLGLLIESHFFWLFCSKFANRNKFVYWSCFRWKMFGNKIFVRN